MITIFFYLTVKPGLETEFHSLGERLTETTPAEDDGCLAYTFFRRADSPREVVLYEQWRDIEAVGAHVGRLQRELGPPDENEPFPPTHHRRRLPKAFLDMCEKTDAVRYEPMIGETE